MDPEDEQMIVLGLLLLIILIDALCTQYLNMMAAAAGACARDRIPKIPFFLDIVVPRMLPDQFRRYFRMSPDTMDKLIRLLIQNPKLQGRVTSNSVDPWRKVYMAAYYLGQQQATFTCAHLFSVAEETFIRCVDEVMEALIDEIGSFIYWPSKDDYPNLASQFDKIGRWFPNVIACLDGCLLPYQVGQGLNRLYYSGHKQYHSINLMAVATFNMAFVDIFVGWPGKSHDSRVFSNAPLFKRIRDFMYIPGKALSDTFTVLADKAFPLCQEIITPFKPPQGETLTQDQWDFNLHMNSKRQTIERAFSLLKRRFKRLLLLNQRTHDRAVNVVTAACILHNICIMENEPVEFLFEEQIVEEDELLWADTPLTNDANSTAGELKRELLKDAVLDHMMFH